ncbi:isochorismate synthase [Rhodococcus aerolatus]
MPTLRVRTRAVPDDADLLGLLPTPTRALSWVRGGEGLVGHGAVAVTTPDGPGRFADADHWWRALVADAEVDDPLATAGTGLVAFVSLAFGDDPGSSVCVVPRVLHGRRDGVAWRTEVTTDDEPWPGPAAVTPVRAPAGARLDGTATDPWRAEVAAAVAVLRAEAGRAGTDALRKVVLARDVTATATADLDERHLLTTLAARFPQCWAFAVDGLVGATPELLLRRRGTAVDARVLAGTSWPRDGLTAGDAARELLGSGKDLTEHRYAVDSLLTALAPSCVDVDAGPVEVLELANVAHLATRVTGTLAGADTSLLALAAAVHPTAAVGGTPTDRAVALIAELESLRRGRFAGPVGWVGADGGGELGVALRCAEVDGPRARLMAGCGIVAASDPDREVAESEAKLGAVRAALGA